MKTQQKSMKNKIAELTTVALMMSLSSAVTPAFAQADRAGNGGDALICAGKPTVLLDSYEAKTLLDRSSINLPSGMGYLEIVPVILDRIKSKDYARGKILEGYWNEIKGELNTAEQGIRTQNINFTQELLSEVSDEMVISLPADCRLQQLVLQVSPEEYKESAWANRVSRYTIQKSLWSSLSEEQKAITITHEFWYRYFLKFGAKSSRNARAMNAIFFTDEYEKLSTKDYFETFSKAEDKSFHVMINTPFGELKMSAPKPGLFKNSLYSDAESNLRLSPGEFIHPLSVNYNAVTGKVNYFFIVNITPMGICGGDCNYKIHYKNVYIFSKSAHIVAFHENGAVKEIYASPEIPVKRITLSNGTVIKNLKNKIFLDQQGNVVTE